MSKLSRISTSLSYLGKFWQDKINVQVFRWNLILIVVQFLYIILRFNDLPPQIPLFYSRPWGDMQLVSPVWIFALPITSFIFSLIDNLISIFYLSSIPLLSRFLIIFSLIFTILATVCLFQVVNLVA